MINITIIGNLGGDTEMKYTPGGDPVTSFSVASNDGSGDKKTTTWYKVSVWGKQAEACHQYLKKGSLVAVVASRLKVSPYLSKQDGQPAASIEVTASNVRFLDSKDKEVPF